MHIFIRGIEKINLRTLKQLNNPSDTSVAAVSSNINNNINPSAKKTKEIIDLDCNDNDEEKSLTKTCQSK